MKTRFFKSGILNHCYQRSADYGLLFYTKSDYLVWFTVLCTVAPRHGVKILAVCPMPDHTHMAVTARAVCDLSRCVGEVNRTFSRLYNEVCNIKASWFERPYGSVPKEGSKVGRNCIIYVGNNPVERKLTTRAEEYRWTFLAYSLSKHPFSQKLVLRRASWPMRQAVREVKAQHADGKPMRYNQLKRLGRKLSEQEREQLIDFIISTYDVIDHKEALRYFDGSYEKMTSAMAISTAREHDLNETFVGWSDRPYAKMTRLLMDKYELNDIHELLSWPSNKKAEAYRYLKRTNNFLPEQIGKFLHWWENR